MDHGLIQKFVKLVVYEFKKCDHVSHDFLSKFVTRHPSFSISTDCIIIQTRYNDGSTSH